MLSKQLSTARIGTILVVLGVFLLVLRVTGSLWGIIISLWPLILVAIGYYQLRNSKNAKQAQIFMLVGGVLLLFTLNLLKLISILGPVVLILSGVYLLTQGNKGIASLMLGGFAKTASTTFRGALRGLNNIFKSYTNNQQENFQQNPKSTNASANAIFRSRSYITSEFSNVSGKCILGDLDIDLRQAKSKESIVYLSVTCSFGSVSIKIPKDWQVELASTKFLGDVVDHSKQEGNINTTLKLSTQCFFGDISISN